MTADRYVAAFSLPAKIVLTGGTTVVGIAIHVVGGARLRRPDLDRWLKKNNPAIESPAVAESVRQTSLRLQFMSVRLNIAVVAIISGGTGYPV
ncbi:MAG: hypothetical protein KGO48_10740 [Alphaproteobacteria bacterium]|nr:hypothetical protein [Alphaproteobacteria bacterium]